MHSLKQPTPQLRYSSLPRTFLLPAFPSIPLPVNSYSWFNLCRWPCTLDSYKNRILLHMFFLFGFFHSTWCSWNMEVLLWTMDMFALLSSLFHIPRAERPYVYFCWWTSKYETKQGFVYPRLVSNTRHRQGRPWTWDPPVSVFQGIDPWGFGRLGKHSTNKATTIAFFAGVFLE